MAWNHNIANKEADLDDQLSRLQTGGRRG